MERTKRALLLNPPGRDTYIRDYYCSKSSRTNYAFPPIALLHAGGAFTEFGWETFGIDAIQENLGVADTLEKVAAIDPDAIFCLVGAVCAEEDRAFLRTLRQRTPLTTIVGCGDVLMDGGRRWLTEKTLDAVALDFTSPSVARFCQGDRHGLEGVQYIERGKIVDTPPFKARTASVGTPPHELFLDKGYRFPFVRRTPFASVLTDYGCPYGCSFCVMSTLAYHRRPLDEVKAEINRLRSLGVREFILWDQTFAASEKWAMDFLELLPEGPDAMGWVCYTRPDKINRGLAVEMSRRGCHTAIMGIETSNDDTLKRMHKGFTTRDTLQAFALCREVGIATVGTAIVGLPGEVERDVRRTIDFVCRVDPDYLSLHTAVPRSGTNLRADMESQGLVSAELEIMDQCGDNGVLSSDSMSAETIKSLHRSFTLKFYLRPRFLARTTLQLLRDPRRLLDQALQGMTLISKNLFR